MAQQTIGIIMNGVTGRMGTNQHLVRSIVAIRNPGGVALLGVSLMQLGQNYTDYIVRVVCRSSRACFVARCSQLDAN